MKTKDGKCTKLFYLIYSMPMIGYCLVAVLNCTPCQGHFELV